MAFACARFYGSTSGGLSFLSAALVVEVPFDAADDVVVRYPSRAFGDTAQDTLTETHHRSPVVLDALAGSGLRVHDLAGRLTLKPMTMPHNPGETPPPPQYVQAPQPAAPSVAKKRINGGAHTVHLVLTICTCGVWGIVWFLHWLFTRSKTVYR